MPHSTPPSSLQSQSGIRKTYRRKAKPIPAHILDHCTDILEEQLYSPTFSLLSSCLTSGGSKDVDAQVPPPQYLALAGTLTVHPALTTRTTSAEKHKAADDALWYLRDLNSILGPQQSGLDVAFQFESNSLPARGKRVRNATSNVTEDDSKTPERLKVPYVDKQALWTNAEDFWRVVGWAFNCSVVHPARWQRWKLFLELVLDVVEDDLQARLPAATKAYIEYGNVEAVRKELQDSMLSQYLLPIGEGRNKQRRLMRAILANGTSTSLAEFPEVWKHETRPPKQKQDRRRSKKRKLDIDNSEFGDYYDRSSDEQSPGTSLRRSRSATTLPTQTARPPSDSDSDATDPLSSPGISTYGGTDSPNLRKRLLALLTTYTTKNPAAFLDTEDLFDLYTEFLRPLPLPIFQAFVLPSKPYLTPQAQMSLNQMLLRPLLVASAPKFREEGLTQEEFETCYAGYAAGSGSAIENARVAVLVEGLLRGLWKTERLEVTGKLRQGVEKGVKARREKVGSDGRKRVGSKKAAEEEAVRVMEAAGERMIALLEL